jgi:transcriptional regulator with XRE-family HTH domain
MPLGSRLRECREKLGRTQLETAKDLGISNVQLSRYESGDRRPDPAMLSRFAEYYRTTTDYLLGRTEDPISERGESRNGDTLPALDAFLNNPEHGVFFKEYLAAPEERKEEMRRFWAFIQEQERGRKPGDRQGEDEEVRP